MHSEKIRSFSVMVINKKFLKFTYTWNPSCWCPPPNSGNPTFRETRRSSGTQRACYAGLPFIHLAKQRAGDSNREFGWHSRLVPAVITLHSANSLSSGSVNVAVSLGNRGEPMRSRPPGNANRAGGRAALKIFSAARRSHGRGPAQLFDKRKNGRSHPAPRKTDVREFRNHLYPPWGPGGQLLREYRENFRGLELVGARPAWNRVVHGPNRLTPLSESYRKCLKIPIAIILTLPSRT